MPTILPSNHTSPGHKPNSTPASLAIPQDTHHSNHTVSDGPSNRVDLINSEHGRILCIADIRGRLSQINELAAEFNAIAVIHSGDFGFYEPSSLERTSDRTLRHLIQYSSLISPQFRSQLLAPNMNVHSIRQMVVSPPAPSASSPQDQDGPLPDFPLSEFPDLLTGKLKFDVPVYTVWGACEDVAILEKIRAAGTSSIKVLQSTAKTSEASASTALSPYSIANLTVLDEATTRCLVIGGVRLRLFGLGGAVVPHKLFDNGEGGATIAGGQGTMWTSVLQIGEVVDTAQRVYDPTETRVLVSHASPGREGLLAQLALVLKADLTISAGLHFRYGVSYNEFSVQHDPESFRGKLHHAKSTFNEIWDTVKGQVEAVIDDHQRQLLSNALAVANRVPVPPPPGGGAGTEEPAWKNSWNWNLPDAAYGSLILDIKEGRIGAEMRSQGFNFAYRASSQPKPPSSATPVSSSSHPLVNAVTPPTGLNSQSSNDVTHSQPLKSTYPAKPATQSQGHNTNSTSPNVNPSGHQAERIKTPSNANHPSNPDTNGKSSFSQGSGSGSTMPSVSRHSPHPSQQHRFSKSRDEKEPSNAQSSRPASVSATVSQDTSDQKAQDSHTKANSSSSANGMLKSGTSLVSTNSKSPTSEPGHGKSAENQERPSSSQAGTSPAPSRKSSFANRKKKGSSSIGGASAKSDADRSLPDKGSDEGHSEGPGSTGNAAGRNLNSTEARETTEPAEPTNDKTHRPPNGQRNEPHPHVGGGGQHSQHKNNRGGSRGRGGPNSYNARNGRGGRGAGRGGGEGFRPSGPGLVGAALAGAGIGNKSNQNGN